MECMGEILCPYCKAGLSDVAIVRCMQCNTVHHNICWLEYGSRCSVFSCDSRQSAIRKRKSGATLLLGVWCIMNYALHLSLQLIGQLTASLRVPDVFVVVLLEALVMGTGWLLLVRWRTSDPMQTAGFLLFSGNALFISWLFSHFVAYGFDGLNALIRL
jgi:hypothetical protein